MTKVAGYFQYYNQIERSTKIIGTDISQFQYNPSVNFNIMAAAGASFVIMRCSRGAGTKDNNFLSVNIQSAKSAGLKVGSYHYSQPSVTGVLPVNAITEADWYIAKLEEEFGIGEYGDLMPVLDFEDPGVVWSSNDEAYDWIEAFINRIKSQTGRQCLLYTAYYYVDPLTVGVNDELIHSTKGGVSLIAPLWLAAGAPDLIENQPPNSYPNYNFTSFGDYITQNNELWTLWQFSSDLNGRGAEFGATSVDIDLDVLEGSLFTIMPPGKPQGVVSTAGNQSALVSWQQLVDPDIVSYKLYKDGVLEATMPKTQTSYLVTGLTNAVQYKFEISGVDVWEEGKKSIPSFATPMAGIGGAKAGKNAKVIAYGSSVPFTDEPTTVTGNIIYQISDLNKSIWCRDCIITVKDTGVPTTEVYQVDRITGRIIFNVAGARTITVTGAFLPTHVISQAFEYNYSLEASNEDSTTFGKQFINREQTLKDITASISKFYDISNYFYDKLTTDEEFILEFYTDGSMQPDIRAWVKISSDNPTAAVDGLVEETIDFEGTNDLDGRCISMGPF